MSSVAVAFTSISNFVYNDTELFVCDNATAIFLSASLIHTCLKNELFKLETN